jgi:hypothetical protein
MSGKQIDWELLKELECPVCMEYMATPIRMCGNGHNICGGCKERLTVCPSCRGAFINVRNFTVEKIAATAIYPCKNRESGCKETFTADDRNIHLSVCLYQSRKCPLSIMSEVDCSWTGTLSDIAAHIRDAHAIRTAEVSGHFKVQLLDVVRQGTYFKLVLVLGEFFWLLWFPEHNELDFTVVHLGLKEGSETFKYGIKVGDSEEYTAGTRKCQSYLDCALTDLKRRESVAISYETILDFVDESGCLSCEVEIGREKLDGFVLEEQQEHLEVVSVVCIELG